MEYRAMNLQLFADGEAAGAPAGGAETGTAAETGSAQVSVGDTLADGSAVQDARVAAALNRQMKRHPEMRGVYLGQGQQAQPEAQPGTQATAAPDGQATEAGQAPENTLEDRWAAMRKGEFRDLYARDVQAAIKDRFKNQEDANRKLDAMQPMLQALMKKSGAGSLEELQEIIVNDDSLYEEEAEAAGMSVESYRKMQQLQSEHDQLVAREKQNREQAEIRRHIGNLQRQAEEMKQSFPDFNLKAEMENETFRNMLSPEMKGRISVKQAYFAVHGDEMIPQLMRYGMERAQQQIGQTLQARQARPQEGAMNGRAEAAEPKINPKALTRKEREAYKQMARMGRFVSFDR